MLNNFFFAFINQNGEEKSEILHLDFDGSNFFPPSNHIINHYLPSFVSLGDWNIIKKKKLFLRFSFFQLL